MDYSRLGPDGPKVSAIALGGASLGSVYDDVPQAQADEVVAAALEHGINLIDVAPYYGLTKAETALGQALRGVERDRYVLMTKVGRYGDKDWDFSRDAIMRGLEDSLSRLGTDRIDVLQCHDIEHGDRRELRDEALPLLRELKADGVIGRIGVTGYDLKFLRDVAVGERVDTVMAYCTYTLQDQRLARVTPDLAMAGVAVFNASPLGMGLLTDRGPPEWHPGHPDVWAAAAEAARICRERGDDISALALRWALQTARGAGFASTVIGMSKASNLKRNLEALTAPIDDELLQAVQVALAPVVDKGWDVLPGSGGKAGA